MHTMTPNVVAVSRGLPVRAAEGLQTVLNAFAGWPLRALQSWQASRRRTLELRALRELSPHVLCDIGIPHEVIGNVQAWRDQHALVRDSIGRGL